MEYPQIPRITIIPRTQMGHFYVGKKKCLGKTIIVYPSRNKLVIKHVYNAIPLHYRTLMHSYTILFTKNTWQRIGHRTWDRVNPGRQWRFVGSRALATPHCAPPCEPAPTWDVPSERAWNAVVELGYARFDVWLVPVGYVCSVVGSFAISSGRSQAFRSR